MSSGTPRLRGSTIAKCARRRASTRVTGRPRSSRGLAIGTRSTRSMRSPPANPSNRLISARTGGTAAAATASASSAASAGRNHGRAWRVRGCWRGESRLATAAATSGSPATPGQSRSSRSRLIADPDLGSQTIEGSRESRLDRAAPAAEHGGRLLLRELEQIAQLDHRPVALGNRATVRAATLAAPERERRPRPGGHAGTAHLSFVGRASGPGTPAVGRPCTGSSLRSQRSPATTDEKELCDGISRARSTPSRKRPEPLPRRQRARRSARKRCGRQCSGDAARRPPRKHARPHRARGRSAAAQRRARRPPICDTPLAVCGSRSRTHAREPDLPRWRIRRMTRSRRAAATISAAMVATLAATFAIVGLADAKIWFEDMAGPVHVGQRVSTAIGGCRVHVLQESVEGVEVTSVRVRREALRRRGRPCAASVASTATAA